MCIYCICTAMALQWLISMILFCLEIVLDGTLVLFSNFLLNLVTLDLRRVSYLVSWVLFSPPFGARETGE